VIPPSLAVNGRTYRRPTRPLVVACVDGCEPEYINQAIASGRVPFIAALRETGTCLTADCVVPSFTNPQPVDRHRRAPRCGICGNYFWDAMRCRSDDSERSEVPARRHDPRRIRDAGGKVAVVTAKDKLACAARPQDGGHLLFLGARNEAHGRNASKGVPALLGGRAVVYSAELSGSCSPRRREAMERDPPDVMYLSTTDYVQHKSSAEGRCRQ
jgi:phosphonoacetate hydrolase